MDTSPERDDESRNSSASGTSKGHVFEVGYVTHNKENAVESEKNDRPKMDEQQPTAGVESQTHNPQSTATMPIPAEIASNNSDDSTAQEGPKVAPGAPPTPNSIPTAKKGSDKKKERKPLTEEERKKQRRTHKVVAIVAAIAIVAAGAIGISVHNQQVAHEEAIARKQAAAKRKREAREAAIKEHDTYVNNLKSVTSYMFTGAVESETACNLTSKVWHNAIFGGWDNETSAYQSSDFNEALKKLYASDTYQGYVSAINKANDKVDDLMRELSDPPEDCEKAYDTLQDLYPDYQSFTSLATDPSGSYTSYTQDFEDLDSKVSSKLQLIDTQIPDPIESSDDSSSS
ncbi:MAG: hypothetical protein DUD35_14640 [Lactobacillus sp.]|nr:MAG: hypothetical protein DUD35_14640 [Lactobacillus sp.]